MHRIQELEMPIGFTDYDLKIVAAKLLNISIVKIKKIKKIRQSLDARRKPKLRWILTVEVLLEEDIVESESKCIPITAKSVPSVRPVVVGFGPAGIFAGLVLAVNGACPIIIERGKPVYERRLDVAHFFRTGELNPESNVQFGEGGAGTFSDGKLTTGIKSPLCRYVLEQLVECGAPEEILWQAKPHIGTDKLGETVTNLRRKIEKLGGQVIFGGRVTKINCTSNLVHSVELSKNGKATEIQTNRVILAIGHSSRDTFNMLYQLGHRLEQKPFAVGVRIEHPQTLIDGIQYGLQNSGIVLPASDYKMAVNLKNGRSVYTFCMCPGGHVVAAASEYGHLTVNGMSEFARDGVNANSAVLVNVTPDDFGSSHPLAGIDFQKDIERNAFLLGGGNYHAPVQRLDDFISRRESLSVGEVMPSYQPGVTWCDLRECLPEFISESLREGLAMFERKMQGFCLPSTVLTGVETRSSSPVRILRDRQTLESVSISGLYPCGEGAGYAGGIMSAAVDGIRCAEAILKIT